MTTLEIPDLYSPHQGCVSTSSSAVQTVVDPEEYAEQEFPKIIPKTVPPKHESRTLVLCFNGTGDQFDADNSNIVQLCWLLKKDDPSQQMVYYQSGVGTYEPPQVPGLLTSKMYKTVDLLIACSLDAHVMEFLESVLRGFVDRVGDHICIFSFSRGAYTARSLVGMLHKVGLLPLDNRQQVPFAYKMYTRTDEIGWCQSMAFKEAFCIDVPIEFVGVCFHKRQHMHGLDSGIKWYLQDDKVLEKMEELYSSPSARPTDVEEVWFAGCHCVMPLAPGAFSGLFGDTNGANKSPTITKDNVHVSAAIPCHYQMKVEPLHKRLQSKTLPIRTGGRRGAS
ncbi:hypothetical protein IW262DRAFT_1486590 [Armillaria fumosa]|nr:hypothetical protein IW262DRAFT_1486590 [Armillaria fumosa]